ncbi:3-hydroxyisobutyrate dehydrogenase/2-hydroxy-3-oxopropionate reductase [Kribbella steppae]|uniref:3-hydroxyisobutyrate dehydrogenase/2-hydroxy-3-oxopropionate reductase n=2 Tax=Kribbella steppae TaxID=2512223 RepID=A0A4R2H4M2_9ACTN|nr:3-hydroxyisobutyrate dehydrogenase/2-hydroxy-3-oxopropionate reductase [Kribbella steppae]
MASTASRPAIGLVGLGHMGSAMATRFLDAGYQVYGTSRTRRRAEPLIAKGLRWRDDPRAVTKEAEVVLTSIPDDAALAIVADGIISELDDRKVWTDLSTVSPRASRELAARVADTGARLLDAPVSGSVPQASAGTLTIMVGGDETAYARVEPVLSVLGHPTYVGSNGQGLALKLGINISLAVQVLAVAEGLLLAERSGVDRAVALRVMTASPIGSPMLRAREQLLLDLPDEAWFDIGLMQKDLVLALEAGRALTVPLPTATVADEMLTVARALGYERRDIAAVFEVLNRLLVR